MNEDLKLIKKYYGEEMMHFCRSNFQSILEQPGKLFSILQDLFAYDKNLIFDLPDSDLNAIQKLVFDRFKCPTINEEGLVETDKSIEQLFSEKGYKLYECKTHADTLKFKKYFAPGEELCTFNDKNRTNNRIVTFAVKNNANSIKRSKNPDRQDEYGVSVISIQIKKDDGTISIKNRYNHTVDNPDATFSNNLENINSGLTKAFEKKYGTKINIKNSLNYLSWFTLAKDGKYYRFNVQNGLLYFCHNNILIYDQKVYKDYTDSGRYLFIDDYIIDLKKDAVENRIVVFDNDIFPSFDYNDYFRTLHKKIDKIEVKQSINNPSNKFVIFYNNNEEPAILTIDKCGNLLSYVNPSVETIGNDFLNYSRKIKHISMNNVKDIGDGFCTISTKLSSIELSSVEHIGYEFCENVYHVDRLDFPKLQDTDKFFMQNLYSCDFINMPSLKETTEFFLDDLRECYDIHMDNCTYVEEHSFSKIVSINYISMENLGYFNKHTFSNLKFVKKFNLPKLRYIDVLSVEDFLLQERLLSQNLTFPQRVKRVFQNWMKY
ncbi:MAG: hypothetical protein IKX00_03510 [Bacilli bacterium]|nr:hypothetical protein [Bacilli bacterium]